MRSEILDLLFLPDYAASIQVLKVEIGGDAQTGFGVEPSHQRTSNETVCERVRTFWLIKEARQRNPNLVVLASAWTFPPWVGMQNASQTSFYSDDAIDYIVSWIRCANETGAGAIDYIGSRPRKLVLDLLGQSEAFEAPPFTWTVALRDALARAELTTRLVLPDAEYDPQMVAMLQSKPQLASALSGGAFGLHYPCFIPLPSLRQEYGLALWSTEDGGMSADWPGGACAGRTVNTNLVRMNVTSTLLRSLVWAVHPAIPGHDDGLISATEPWSGRYAIQDPLWMLAHTSRFTKVGWLVLPLQSGASGHLKKGGTFVTYLSPDRSSFTLVVEKLQAPCRSCAGATAGAEEVVFTLSDRLVETLPSSVSNASNEELDDPSGDTSEMVADESSNESPNESNASNVSNETVMRTEVHELGSSDGLAFFLTNKTHKLFQLPPLAVDLKTASFSFVVQPDTIYTITSMNLTATNLSDLTDSRGPRNSTEVLASSFPVPYQDDFDLYVPDETPGYFADYGGSFQVSQDPSYPANLVLKQGLLEKAGANRWTSASDPITLIGHRLANVVATVDVYLPDAPLAFHEPVRLGIQAAWNGHCLSTSASAREMALVFQESCEVGTEQNFFLEPSTGRILTATSTSIAKSCLSAHLCSDGPYADRRVCVRRCSAGFVEQSNQTWEWYGDGSLRLKELPDFCLTQGVGDTESPLELTSCGHPVLPKQRFLDTRGEMTRFAGICLRLEPRQGSDPGELLNGLPGRTGYCLRLGTDAMNNGVWRLESGGGSARLLARGRVFAPLSTWHRLRLAANGTVVRVKVDDQDEVVAIDSDHSIGSAALFSGWHEAFYDNFALDPVASLEPVYY